MMSFLLVAQVSRFSPYEWQGEDSDDEDEVAQTTTSQRTSAPDGLQSPGFTSSPPTCVQILLCGKLLICLIVFPQNPPSLRTRTNRKKRTPQSTATTLGSSILCGFHWGLSCNRAVISPPGKAEKKDDLSVTRNSNLLLGTLAAPSTAPLMPTPSSSVDSDTCTTTFCSSLQSVKMQEFQQQCIVSDTSGHDY